MKRLGVREIAKLAGVSPTTVSLALNDSPRLPESTKDRIRAIARKAGYRPNLLARGLRGGSTHTVGIISWTLRDLFYTELLVAQERCLCQHGYSSLLAFSERGGPLAPGVEETGSDPDAHVLEASLLRGADGLLFHRSPWSPEDDEALARLAKSNMPMVFYGAPHVGADQFEGADSVHNDFEGATHQLTRHLIELGHRRIACVSSVPNRQTGYRRALRDAGIESDPQPELAHTEVDYGILDTAEIRKELMAVRRRPTAVVAHNDDLAIELITELRRDGHRVPEDISVVGINDGWYSEHMGLTTARLHIEEIAEAMVELLIERMADPTLPPRHREIGFEMVVRQSTAPPPAEVAVDMRATDDARAAGPGLAP